MFQILVPVFITIGFLAGIRLMQSPRSALWGNRLGALCMALAAGFVFWELELASSYAPVYIGLGAATGILLGQRVKMIQMPQTVALFNGLGGGASALVAITAVAVDGGRELWVFWLSAALALGIGVMTLSGSIVAALKLQGRVLRKPVFLKGHGTALRLLLPLGAALVLLLLFSRNPYYHYTIIPVFALYGLLMSLRIGGADMPVIISFLNSFSGIAAAVTGFAVENFLLVGVGSLVGVAGMVLTRVMCRAMNRNLLAVLGGFKAGADGVPEKAGPEAAQGEAGIGADKIPSLLREAKKVILVPGYGMALAQAQQAVKEFIDVLERDGKEVRVAIHPVAGRMPGHMNVLLAEVGLDYEKLCDMDTVNPEFENTDVVIVIGACDVINPAAMTAEGTPIYGMPVLGVSSAGTIIVCNLDEKPGYSGVNNPLYGEENVITVWGDAAQTVAKIIAEYRGG